MRQALEQTLLPAETFSVPDDSVYQLESFLVDLQPPGLSLSACHKSTSIDALHLALLPFSALLSPLHWLMQYNARIWHRAWCKGSFRPKNKNYYQNRIFPEVGQEPALPQFVHHCLVRAFIFLPPHKNP